MTNSKAGTPEEDRQTEDESAREKLGPRGVPGAPDTAKMTAQEDKNIPKSGVFDGHTAQGKFIQLAEIIKSAGHFKESVLGLRWCAKPEQAKALVR